MNSVRSGPAIDGQDIAIEVDVTETIARHGGTTTVEYRRNRRGGGLDVHPIDEIFHLRVPPNTKHGQVLVVDKMGHSGANGGISGSLHCKVKIVPSVSTYQANKKSQQETNDVDVEVPISFPEAIFGTRIKVDTPTGKLLLSVPARSSSGRKLRLRGRGENGSDFIISLKIVVPDDLDPDSLLLVQKFAERNPISPRQED